MPRLLLLNWFVSFFPFPTRGFLRKRRCQQRGWGPTTMTKTRLRLDLSFIKFFSRSRTELCGNSKGFIKPALTYLATRIYNHCTIDINTQGTGAWRPLWDTCFQVLKTPWVDVWFPLMIYILLPPWKLVRNKGGVVKWWWIRLPRDTRIRTHAKINVLMESLAFASNTARPLWKSFFREISVDFPRTCTFKGKEKRECACCLCFFISRILSLTNFLPNTFLKLMGFHFPGRRGSCCRCVRS